MVMVMMIIIIIIYFYDGEMMVVALVMAITMTEKVDSCASETEPCVTKRGCLHLILLKESHNTPFILVCDTHEGINYVFNYKHAYCTFHFIHIFVYYSISIFTLLFHLVILVGKEFPKKTFERLRWSLGVCTYVILCGKPPFWGRLNQQLKMMKKAL